MRRRRFRGAWGAVLAACCVLAAAWSATTATTELNMRFAPGDPGEQPATGTSPPPPSALATVDRRDGVTARRPASEPAPPATTPDPQPAPPPPPTTPSGAPTSAPPTSPPSRGGGQPQHAGITVTVPGLGGVPLLQLNLATGATHRQP